MRLSFVEGFREPGKSRQAADFEAYLERLRTQSAALDAADPNRQGMLIVLQVGEQMLPLIREGSLPLSEGLEIEIGRQAPRANFLADSSSRIN